MTPDEGTYTQVKKRVTDSLNVLPKPKMRGWIHTVTVPLSLAASIVLICLANTANERWACAVYLVCSLLLFGVSSLYHRIDWGKRAHSVMRRLDHCNFLVDCGVLYPDRSLPLVLPPGEKPIGAGVAGCLGRNLTFDILARCSPVAVCSHLHFAGVGSCGLYGAATSSRRIGSDLATSGRRIVLHNRSGFLWSALAR